MSKDAEVVSHGMVPGPGACCSGVVVHMDLQSR
jgi:hypothetical protein